MWELVSDTLKARYTFKTVSCKLIRPDHFWQPGSILATKSGPGSDQFWQLLIIFCSRSSRVALCDHKVIKTDLRN